jgi:alpha-galactosidase
VERRRIRGESVPKPFGSGTYQPATVRTKRSIAYEEASRQASVGRRGIAIDQDTAVKPVQMLAEQGKVKILERPLQDGSAAVGIFNRGETPADGALSGQSLKLPGKTLKVRDLWKHEAVPATGDSYSSSIPPHGVVLLKVSSAHQ